MAKRRCNACKNAVIDFDYKDSGLSRFLNSWAKIKSRRESRLCSRHQRNLATAIKRARYLALLPYTPK
ncbi:MAG: 30S ribosomal protein S18 [Candidatus Berkelbacteria bacterium]|nr:30S ribosomal protein S18 [Candidatus Berkelbacteria bacterium]